MILLQTNKISKSFAAELILSDISIEVKLGERVALVGRNGAGKSTLLKIIAGELSADSGDVVIPKDRTIGYLPQNATLNSNQSIFNELLSVFRPLTDLEKRLRNMEEKMADPARFASQKEYEQFLQTYDALQAEFKSRGGYTYPAEIRSVLNGLNFGAYPEDTPVSTLSGGQKTRLALGKLLLQKPDLLILDEPTNHLDIETLTWLEGYLQRYKGSVLVVSHDRYFLDKVVNKVYEIAGCSARKYNGNYSRFLKLRAAAFAAEMKHYDKQKKEIARLSEFVQKNIVRASTTKRAQSRRKQLEKMDITEKPRRDEKSIRFSFDIERESGRDVLAFSDLSLGYAHHTLLSGLNGHISRGERVALVGPNGIGKSTLLKAIASGATRLSGDIRQGSHVTIGYYDQEQSSLSPGKTVLNELWDDYPLLTENDIRGVLGLFLFSGDDVKKNVSQLSGGEKARLMLAKLMMRRDNFLILDEPTNHLDLDSKEVLEAALLDYPGTILFVSHDRYFINHIATRVLELSQEGITNYLGDYDYYIEKRTENKEIAELEAKTAPLATKEEQKPAPGKAQYLKDKEAKKQRRRLARLIEQIERDISRLEDEIAAREQSLLKPEVYNDVKKAKTIQMQMERDKKTLDEQMEKWETLQFSLDEWSEQG
ncbi:ABC transporter ATP-binding protein [Sporolactobacillus sp. THM7-7]|nr:ABC transporter ATP-binding protein [Sporolactobacillus sp. THM7-7]